jgi:RNA polymerase sigma-32 factor
MIPESRPNQEVAFIAKQERTNRSSWLKKAMNRLSEREKHIVTERMLKEVPTTLDVLGQYYKLSKERIRQIEERAIEKLTAMASGDFDFA